MFSMRTLGGRPGLFRHLRVPTCLLLAGVVLRGAPVVYVVNEARVPLSVTPPAVGGSQFTFDYEPGAAASSAPPRAGADGNLCLHPGATLMITFPASFSFEGAVEQLGLTVAGADTHWDDFAAGPRWISHAALGDLLLTRVAPRENAIFTFHVGAPPAFKVRAQPPQAPMITMDMARAVPVAFLGESAGPSRPIAQGAKPRISAAAAAAAAPGREEVEPIGPAFAVGPAKVLDDAAWQSIAEGLRGNIRPGSRHDRAARAQTDALLWLELTGEARRRPAPATGFEPGSMGALSQAARLRWQDTGQWDVAMAILESLGILSRLRQHPLVLQAAASAGPASPAAVAPHDGQTPIRPARPAKKAAVAMGVPPAPAQEASAPAARALPATVNRPGKSAPRRRPGRPARGAAAPLAAAVAQDVPQEVHAPAAQPLQQAAWPARPLFIDDLWAALRAGVEGKRRKIGPFGARLNRAQWEVILWSHLTGTEVKAAALANGLSPSVLRQLNTKWREQGVLQAVLAFLEQGGHLAGLAARQDVLAAAPAEAPAAALPLAVDVPAAAAGDGLIPMVLPILAEEADGGLGIGSLDGPEEEELAGAGASPRLHDFDEDGFPSAKSVFPRPVTPQLERWREEMLWGGPN